VHLDIIDSHPAGVFGDPEMDVIVLVRRTGFAKAGAPEIAAVLPQAAHRPVGADEIEVQLLARVGALIIERSLIVPGICNQLLQAVQINDAGQELSADYNARCTSKVQCMGFRVVARK